MATAGTLKAVLTADTAQFKSGLNSARADLGTFKNSVTSAQGETKGFSAHLATSRSSLQAFAAATGASAGELRHMVHAFEMMPGPIGAAIAAIFIMKAATDDLAESQTKAAESNARWVAGLKETRMKMDGLKFTPTGERMNEIGGRVKEMTQRKNEIIDESRNVFSAIWFALKNYASGGQLGQERINEINEIKSGLAREKATANQLRGRAILESVGGFSGSGAAAGQAIGQDVGAFKVEHGENEQLQVLRQIAENTGRGTSPVSNFH